MIAYILRRLLGAAFVVFCVFSISFIIMRLAPGSPFDQDRQLPPQVVANQAQVTGMARAVPSPAGVLHTLHVKRGDAVSAGQTFAIITVDGRQQPLKADQPFTVFRIVRKVGDGIEQGRPILYAETHLWTQYWTTLTHYMRLDFGVTFDSKGQRTVWENIRETLPVSAELGLYALFIALFLGVTSGLLAGMKQNTWVDHSVMSAAMIGISVPSIVLGPVFILVFIMELQWLPAHGGWESGLFTGWGQKILPAITLGLAYGAYFARLTRGGMLEVVRQDWIRTARAKGLSESRIVFRHALKGAILPAVTFLGPALAHLLVGSVIVEMIFSIPGISKYFVVSAINRDYPMVMGVVVLYSSFLVLFNLLVDIAYAYLDPRVQYE
jgi:oligopeptide transport system permease protein